MEERRGQSLGLSSAHGVCRCPSGKRASTRVCRCSSSFFAYLFYLARIFPFISFPRPAWGSYRPPLFLLGTPSPLRGGPFDTPPVLLSALLSLPHTTRLPVWLHGHLRGLCWRARVAVSAESSAFLPFLYVKTEGCGGAPSWLQGRATQPARPVETTTPT